MTFRWALTIRIKSFLEPMPPNLRYVALMDKRVVAMSGRKRFRMADPAMES
jgi:hypothetical protein